MAANKIRIENTPDEFNTEQSSEQNNSMGTNNGVPREQANVEAEKGETMVTSNGVSNQKKIVAIGGKKHSEGGTPLDLPDGTIIYSDKLKVKDPLILKFFNESGKKAKTFAELSKKYDITKWGKELEDEDNDKITNDSLEKNLDDGNFKLSALFAIQEFHEEKGAPEEHSKHFEPFMERMGIKYDELFGTQNAQEGEQPLLAKNGTEISFDDIPAMDGGGVTGHGHNADKSHFAPGSTRYAYKDRYKKVGWTWQNELRKGLNLEPLDKSAIGNRDAMEKGAKELQEWFGDAKNIELVKDFAFTKSDRPTNKTQKLLRDLGLKPSKGKDFTNDDLFKFYNDGDIDTDLIVDGLQDGRWTERGAFEVVKDVDQATYDSKQKEILERGIDGPNGLKYLWMGDGKYEAYRVNPDGSIEQVEADPKVADKLFNWENDQTIEDRSGNRNMDYRWDHRRALDQARKNKTQIPRLAPFTPIEEARGVDQMYYNADEAISSMQSMVSNAGTKQAMFAPQQQQTANFLAGQQFELMGKIISNYEDKNVAAYNQENLTNTSIANRSAQRLASAIEGHHDKTTTLQQEYANARTNADNNIAENEIAMWNERRTRMNLEATVGEQYATNPNTGLHELIRTKDIRPGSGTSQDIANIYTDIQNRVPAGTSSADITRMAMAVMKGDYTMAEDVVPNADNYNP